MRPGSRVMLPEMSAVTARVLSSHRGQAVTVEERVVVRGNNK